MIIPKLDEANLKLWQQFVKELQSESSDRAKAIVGAAFLEPLLGQLFSKFMVGDTSAKARMLNGVQAPLGTFSSRILAAYHFGLITDEEKHDLDIIRKIRNKFAHDLGVTFVDQSIRDRCANFKIHSRIEVELGSPPPSSAAQRYIFEVSMLATFLNYRIHSTKQIVPAEPLYFQIGENVKIDLS